MEVRVKYANYDTSEFKSFGEKDLNFAINLFNSFPWEDEVRKIEDMEENKTYPIIKLQRNKKECVEINGFSRGEEILYNLKVKYKNKIWRVIIGLDYDKTKALDFIVRYYNNNMKNNVDYIKSNKSTSVSAFLDFLVYNFYDNDKIVDIDRNIKRKFKYDLKPKKVIFALIPSLLFLLFPLFLGIIYSFDYFSIFLFLIFGSIAIPGLIVAINHIIHSQSKELIFEKNSNKFVLLERNEYKTYNKNDIEIINQYHTGSFDRSPWGFREYWRIEMNNKEVILISNLIMSEMDIMKFFGLQKIHDNKVFFPMIK